MRYIGFINRDNTLKIGTVFIIVSVVLFSASILAIYGSVSSHDNVNFQSAGKTVSYTYHVSEGNTIQYSIKVVNGTNYSITSYLISPNNNRCNSLNFTGSSASSSIIAEQSGNWTIFVTSNNNSNLTLDIYFGNLPYYEQISTVLGFTLLVIGIGMIGVHYMIKRREVERIRRKFR
ncbi:MAG: hypothetical protein ACYDAO_06130 [Thermoplasmataceae archaeon]